MMQNNTYLLYYYKKTNIIMSTLINLEPVYLNKCYFKIESFFPFYLICN